MYVTSTPPQSPTGQADQIWQALVKSLEMGLVKESLYGRALNVSDPDYEFTPEKQWEALDILTKSRARAPLSKAGIFYPTKKDFDHPVKVTALSDDLWRVETTTKGTQYTVKRDGFALKCSCPSPDFTDGFVKPGWCKHIDAVEDSEPASSSTATAIKPDLEQAWRQVTAQLNPLGTRVLFQRHGVLESFDGPTATVLFNSDPLLGIALTRVENVETAFETVFQHPVKVSIKNADGQIVSAPQSQPDFSNHSIVKPPPFPEGFTPTKDQQIAWDGLHRGLNERASMMLLQGGAGTGKTTLITALFQGIQSQPIPPQTCAVAPTNQAKDVLKGMLRGKGIQADVMTAAQLFGMRMDEFGEFDRDYTYEHPVDKYDLILADECSSYGSKYWQHFQSESLKGKRFIFMGDEAQLWEVNGGEPPAFTDIPSEWRFNLNEVKRYGGAVLSTALEFRSAITQRKPPIITPNKDEGLYVMSDSKAWLQAVVRNMKKSEVPGDYVAIVYRNCRVEEINNAVHQSIHGPNADRFYEGQTLIADAPHMDSCVTTSQRLTIERLQKGTVGGYDCHFISFWGECGFTTAPVLTQDALIDFTRQCKAFKQAKQGWRARKLESQFLWVSYSHAITAHKAQGSTLGTVFLDLKDIGRCSTKRKRRRDGVFIYEAPQLGYVGLTRASGKVVALQ
jgi:hypothetical protein